MNLMVANWAIGKKCEPSTLCEKLRVATFDLVVMVTSSAVAESDHIQQCLDELAEGSTRVPFVADMLKEKQGGQKHAF